MFAELMHNSANKTHNKSL